MSAPYSVKIVASNAEGEELTSFVQKLKNYEEFVAYQRTITEALLGLGDAEIDRRKSSGKKA